MERLHYQVLCSLFLFLCFHFHVECSSSFPSSYSSSNSTISLCPPEQSLALLQFKYTTPVNSEVYQYCGNSDPYPKTDSWIEGSDCCSWDGVTCDKATGNVIGLDLSCSFLYGPIQPSSSLFHLSHLQWLNLANNDFRDTAIPSEFGRLRELIQLDLSYSGFSGPVPSEISQLSKLVSLNLSDAFYRSFVTLDQQTFELIASNLTRLSVVILSGVNMSLVPPVSLLNLSSSITVLSLPSTGMQGQCPDHVFTLPNLQELTLSYNEGLMGYLPESNWSSHLRLLDISLTNFTGKLPGSIGDLKFLEKIDFSACSFTGPIPTSIGNLSRVTRLQFSNSYFADQLPASLSKLEELTYLDLSQNVLAGQIPDIFYNLSKLTGLFLSSNNFSGQLPPSLFSLTQLTDFIISYNHLTGPLPDHVTSLSKLRSLDLSHNYLNSRVPSWLFTLPSLDYIRLQYNQLTGPIEEFELPNSLIEVYLASNKINGSFPNSIFKLEKLNVLDLSSNNLTGSVKFDMLVNFPYLQRLNLSYNDLLSFSSNSIVNYTSIQLKSLTLTSCNIKEFPSFFGFLENLMDLDLSKNKIHGTIPKFESQGWKSLISLNLSHNFLTYIEEHPWKNVSILDLGNNLLEGSLLVPPAKTSVFLVSNNKLTGKIPQFICNLSFLYVFDLSNNNFNGNIPQCLGNFSISLQMLHLHMNNLQGSIPDTFANGSSLTSLNLNGNMLEGPLPRSLTNCHQLEVINIGNNKINDTLPCWLGTLPELKVLVLGSNRFHGAICDSKIISPFSNLRMIDLSYNEFSSFLPETLFGNLKAMMNMNEGEIQYIGGAYYQDSVNVIMKDQVLKLDRILTIFKSIDLSNNQFQGVIPKVFGKFKAVVALNLSHNSLTGNIPSTLGNMIALESLDLSSNKLEGRIPEELRSLTFLSVLKLSHNQLWGRIPQGNQFYTFESDSFIGNIGLCGEPLSVKCGDNGVLQPPPSISYEEDDSSSGFDWNFIMMGYGSGLVIGFSMGYMVFSTGKPQWFVRIFEGEYGR